MCVCVSMRRFVSMTYVSVSISLCVYNILFVWCVGFSMPVIVSLTVFEFVYV